MKLQKKLQTIRQNENIERQKCETFLMCPKCPFMKSHQSDGHSIHSGDGPEHITCIFFSSRRIYGLKAFLSRSNQTWSRSCTEHSETFFSLYWIAGRKNVVCKRTKKSLSSILWEQIVIKVCALEIAAMVNEDKNHSNVVLHHGICFDDRVRFRTRAQAHTSAIYEYAYTLFLSLSLSRSLIVNGDAMSGTV